MKSHPPMKRAFSLVELLVVVAIVIVMMVLIIPAISSIGRSSSLSSAVQTVTGTLNLARQTAVTQNRTVEVRFYKLPEDGQSGGTPADYNAMQMFLVDYDTTNAISRTEKLPAPAIVANLAAASSLMDESLFPEKPAPAGVTVSPAGSNYRYRSFRFKPDGSADLAFDGKWFFSLVNKRDPVTASNLPANYATIHIEPMTGRINVVRP